MQSGREYVIKNGKKISLLILLIGFGFTFFILSSKMTGLAVGDNAAQNIERSQESVNFLIQERETCFDDLGSARSSYNGCQSDLLLQGTKLDNCTQDLGAAENDLEACNLGKNLLETQLTKKIADYELLAKNSVTSICCSFSDYKSGAVKSWDISDNNILCSGSKTVNCTSGEVA